MRDDIKRAFIQIPATAVFVLVILSAVYYIRQITYPVIAARVSDSRIKGFESALPGYVIGDEIKVPSVNGSSISYRVGTKMVEDAEKRGYVFDTLLYGYQYRIRISTGIDENGIITGLSAAYFADFSDPDASSVNDTGSSGQRGYLPGRSLSSILEPGSRYNIQFRGIDLARRITVVDASVLSKYTTEDIAARNSVIAPYGDRAAMEYLVNEITGNYIKLKYALALSVQVTDGVTEEKSGR